MIDIGQLAILSVFPLCLIGVALFVLHLTKRTDAEAASATRRMPAE